MLGIAVRFIIIFTEVTHICTLYTFQILKELGKFMPGIETGFIIIIVMIIIPKSRIKNYMYCIHIPNTERIG